jgi:ATP-dependent Lon protease
MQTYSGEWIMQELMTRQRHHEIIHIEMPAEFPWTQQAQLAVAPGHVEVARRYLQSIESIVGRDELHEKLRFLRLADTEQRGFRVYIDVNGLSEARTSAVQDAGADAVTASHHICAACGRRFERRTRYCSTHAEKRTLFADDVTEPAMPLKSEGDRPSIADTLADLMPTGGDGLDPGVEPHAPPSLLVFAAEDVIQLDKSAEGKDSDTRERIRSVVKKLQGVEGSKPLALVPDGWRAKLEQFEADFPNFAAFVEFLRDRFALAELGDRSIDIPPVLFDGPPGIGKTEVALSFAALFETGSMELDMAVAQSNSALAGSEAFWANSREGRLFQTLAFGRTANPLVFLDELDKMSGAERHRPDAALYQLLEPRTASAFRDLSLQEIKLNASRVLWFAATNDLALLNPPIRSRFVVFSIPAPTREQCKAIAHSIYRNLLAANTWGAAMAPDISDLVATRVARLPPREMRIKLSQACGRAARQGRKEVKEDDVVLDETTRKPGIGFIREPAR